MILSRYLDIKVVYKRYASLYFAMFIDRGLPFAKFVAVDNCLLQ